MHPGPVSFAFSIVVVAVSSLAGADSWCSMSTPRPSTILLLRSGALGDTQGASKALLMDAFFPKDMHGVLLYRVILWTGAWWL